jgi:uncharacterized membrane protein
VTDSDLLLRWVIVVEGIVAAVAVIWASRAGQRTATPRSLRAELVGTTGGAAVCLAVSAGTLGVIFGFDTVWRLPFMATALAYIIAGRVYQLVLIHRARRAAP